MSTRVKNFSFPRVHFFRKYSITNKTAVRRHLAKYHFMRNNITSIQMYNDNIIIVEIYFIIHHFTYYTIPAAVLYYIDITTPKANDTVSNIIMFIK